MRAEPVPLSRRNLIALDGVRGLAILAVMIVHLDALQPGGGLLHRTLRFLVVQGWTGVDLFFVLSGFLITGILLDTRECRNYFSSFYCRRALRIFPLSYAFLLVAWLTFPVLVRDRWMPLRSDWWLYPTYLMNWQVLWNGDWHENILGHVWSLCVEEQFYFTWPLMVLVLRPRSLLRALVCIELAIIVGRAWWILQHGPSTVLATATITRMDGLLFGAGCAAAVRQFRFPRWAIDLMPWTFAISYATFLAVTKLLGRGPMMYAGIPLIGFGFSALLLYAVLTDSEQNTIQNWLRWTPLTRMGKYAYGIYIFHVPVFYFLDEGVRHLPGSIHRAVWVRLGAIVLKMCISFILAWLSYNYFEKRFLQWKKHFEPEYERERHMAATATPSLT